MDILKHVRAPEPIEGVDANDLPAVWFDEDEDRHGVKPIPLYEPGSPALQQAIEQKRRHVRHVRFGLAGAAVAAVVGTPLVASHTENPIHADFTAVTSTRQVSTAHNKPKAPVQSKTVAPSPKNSERDQTTLISELQQTKDRLRQANASTVTHEKTVAKLQAKLTLLENQKAALKNELQAKPKTVIVKVPGPVQTKEPEKTVTVNNCYGQIDAQGDLGRFETCDDNKVAAADASGQTFSPQEMAAQFTLSLEQLLGIGPTPTPTPSVSPSAAPLPSNIPDLPSSSPPIAAQPSPSETSGNKFTTEEAAQTIWSFNTLGSTHTKDGWDNGKHYASGVVRAAHNAALIKREKPDEVGFQELQADEFHVMLTKLGNDYSFIPAHPSSKHYSENTIIIRKDRFELLRARKALMEYFNGQNSYMPDVTVRDRVTGEIEEFDNRHYPANTGKYHGQFKYRKTNAQRDYRRISTLAKQDRFTVLQGDHNEAEIPRPWSDGKLGNRNQLGYCILTQSIAKDQYALQNAYDLSKGVRGHCPVTEGEGKHMIDYVMVSDGTKINKYTIDRKPENKRDTDHPVIKVKLTTPYAQAALQAGN